MRTLVTALTVAVAVLAGSTFALAMGPQHDPGQETRGRNCEAPGHDPDGGETTDQGHDTFQGRGLGHCDSPSDPEPPTEPPTDPPTDPPVDPPPTPEPPTPPGPPPIVPPVDPPVGPPVEPPVGPPTAEPPEVDGETTIEATGPEDDSGPSEDTSEPDPGPGSDPVTPEPEHDFPTALPNSGSGGLAHDPSFN